MGRAAHGRPALPQRYSGQMGLPFGAENADGKQGQRPCGRPPVPNDARGTADNFVDLGFPVVITDVACGQYHTAVLADGLLFVFGGNDSG